VRAILNLPLGATNMVKPAAVMVNLLGKKEGLGIVEDYKEALEDEDLHLHIYGKDMSRVGRKMGHITMLGNDTGIILRTLKKIEPKIII
jgi:phosphoribosylaminoimidazole carboxylase (NCAIR synthetase)